MSNFIAANGKEIRWLGEKGCLSQYIIIIYGKRQALEFYIRTSRIESAVMSDDFYFYGPITRESEISKEENKRTSGNRVPKIEPIHHSRDADALETQIEG